MITKVRQLTRMNLDALHNVQIGAELGATYANFDGSPVQALAAVEQAMVSRGIDSTYHSLKAVRRKLAAAAPRWSAASQEDGKRLSLTPYVDVIR